VFKAVVPAALPRTSSTHHYPLTGASHVHVLLARTCAVPHHVSRGGIVRWQLIRRRRPDLPIAKETTKGGAWEGSLHQHQQFQRD
jgi:hypothetical protein